MNSPEYSAATRLPDERFRGSEVRRDGPDPPAQHHHGPVLTDGLNLPAVFGLGYHVVRESGHDYELFLDQPHRPNAEPLVQLHASDEAPTSVTLHLSAGEARSMAARLIHAAELLDLDCLER